MNICVVNPNFYRSSGVTVAIRRLYEGSEKLPVEWHFVDCLYGSGAENNSAEWIPGARRCSLSLMTANPFALAKALVKFYQYLKRERIQVLHVHHRRLALIAGKVAHLLGIPVVYTGHLTYEDSLAFRMAPIDRAVAISPSVKDNILATTGLTNLTLISNPAPFEDVVPAIGSECHRTVACVARLEPVKNHETLIKAWAKLGPVERKFQLLLVGEGSLRGSLEALCDQLGIRSTVQFLGFTDDVSGVIKKSLFLVLPSWREGHPLAVIEGAGLGRATLLTNVDGSKDCVPPEALLPNKVDALSVEDMAAALDAWLKQPEKVVEEGREYFHFWKACSSKEYVAKSYLNVYQSLRKYGSHE